MIKAIVTDIEGTTSSIHFVHDVLFPYAAKHLPAFIRGNRSIPAVDNALQEVARISTLAPDDTDALITQLLQWIASDQKVTPLKTLQGLVWEQGYRNGDYKAHIYHDALAALQKWHQQGLALYVYSSGSIYAQKLFFGFSEGGDLTTLFQGYFDTVTGPKREADSYQKIQQALGWPAEEILFLSDIVEELDAAAEVGMHTAWLQREGDMLQHPRHQCATTFTDIALD
ncbi:MAG: acireductone synthase [Zhongshania sp.]|uniref:acireductone synthase n=1 Tax=Zhongshania sp. TaxID=1971902 RepID=UPI00261DEF41|nr:acireductone synthase [Zhongshania sp.]MDF1691842.1 acireductone synthase [Zhongshania sp.]